MTAVYPYVLPTAQISGLRRWERIEIMVKMGEAVPVGVGMTWAYLIKAA